MSALLAAALAIAVAFTVVGMSFVLFAAIVPAPSVIIIVAIVAAGVVAAFRGVRNVVVG